MKENKKRVRKKEKRMRVNKSRISKRRGKNQAKNSE